MGYYWSKDKITLRPTIPSDWVYFYENYFESETRFLYYTETELPLDMSSAKARFSRFLRTAEKKGRTDLTVLGEDGHVVGSLNLYDIDRRSGSFQIATFISDGERGKGYAKSALLLLLDYAFCELRLHKYNARILKGNTASRALHEKIGAKHEGTLRDMFYHDGGYVDVEWWGMTDEEYKERYKQKKSAASTYGELDFLPLSIKELPYLLPSLSECKAMLCDYTAGGLLFGIHRLYAPQYSKGKNATYISVRSEDGSSREFLLPLPYSTEAIDELCEYTKRKNLPLVFSGLTEKYAMHIARHLHCSYSMTDELCDYVYDAKALSTLEGSDYHTHRTNIRKLQRMCNSWEYKALTKENIGQALDYADRLFADLDEESNKYASSGKDIVYDSLRNFDSLCLYGGVLYVDGNVCGVAVGSIKQDMLYIHVLRADRDIWGAWNLLCREFVSAHADKIKYVNMEDDLGEEGIRRMKMSYAPIEFINRCRVGAE